jgi:Fur family ferric uptake transcriptional regulator
VSRATVYRTIDVLVKNNMVRKLELGDGRARYEHKINSTHHDHLICVHCGRIEEFMDEEIEKLQEKIVDKLDFKLIRHIHQLFVICNDCKDS